MKFLLPHELNFDTLPFAFYQYAQKSTTKGLTKSYFG